MKFTFYLRYHTKFGENLFITGNASALGKNNELVPLQYLNNDYWKLETEISLTALNGKKLKYQYKLVTKNGEILDESHFIRKVALSSSYSNFVIYDVWNFAGTFDNVFFTEPFKNILLPHFKISKELYKNEPTHCFRIKAPQLKKDQAVCILGNTSALKNWNESEPILMKFDGEQWLADINLTGTNFPLAYKYGLYDKKQKSFLKFEEGDNRICFEPADENKLTLLQDGFLNLQEKKWKGAGVAIPVFSLKSKSGLGVGEFNDIELLADWAHSVGIKLIQILPINDTTSSFTWRDSYPYSAISAFALHPIYINLETVAGKHHKSLIAGLKEDRKKLNDYKGLDYEQVMQIKTDLLKKIYEIDGEACFKTNEYKDFFETNKGWLKEYAAFCFHRDHFKTANPQEWANHCKFDAHEIENLFNKDAMFFHEVMFHCFVQFHLHVQLKKAVHYAHKKGIVLKGDIPIGVNRNSCDAWIAPDQYHMDMQAGAPPDDFAISGQNWGFPTYNWQKMQQDNFAWWRDRFTQMSNYFDAFRIDHILGFFRIWSIPYSQVQGIMGVFDPCLPITVDEFGARSIYFDFERFCTPYITDEVLNETFGELSSFVKDNYLQKHGPFQYKLLPEFDTQRKVESFFKTHTTDNQDKLLTGLYNLISNILLFEKENSNQTEFNFRFGIDQTSSFRNLAPHLRQQLWEMYIDYFYNRQNDFWRKEALKKLPQLSAATDMLVCGEDLGMVPETVPTVMKQLGILSLEIQRMPKQTGIEFFNPANAPYLSVVTPSTHDMSTIRGWWEEERSASQRFFNNELGLHGEAPYYCEPWVSRAIILQHLHSPAIWSIFQLQDLFSITNKLRVEKPNDERINVPANPHHYWRFRMSITLEQLIKEDAFNDELKGLVQSSGR